MGDAEEADYQAALGGEQTELAPSESGTEAHTAWALDDGPEWKPPFWTAGRITAAVAGTAVVVAVAAAGIVGYHLRDEPPAPVASMPAPTAPPAAPTTIAPDPNKVFLVEMRSLGWDIKVPEVMTMNARRVCEALESGMSFNEALGYLMEVSGRYEVDAPLTEDDYATARVFVAAAMRTYPACG